MTETNETKEFNDSLISITKELKDLINNIGSRLKKFFGIELEKTTNETRNELDVLEDELFKKNEDEIKKELDDIEGNMNNKETILGKLLEQIPELKEWFDWILEKNNGEYIIDEKTRKAEVESFLLLLKNKTNNESDKSKPDLNINEINDMKNYSIKKKEVCKKVLQDDRIKNIPDEEKTKQKVLQIYNDLLKEKEDYNLITEDLIIEKMVSKE